MVPLLLVNIEAIFSSMHILGNVLHFVFALFLVIGRVRGRVALGIRIIERTLPILGIAVLEADAIKPQTAHLNFKALRGAKVHAFIYLGVPVLLHDELFALVRPPLVGFNLLSIQFRH